MSGAPPQVAYSLAHTYPNQIISSYSLRIYNASVMNYHLLCQGVVYPIPLSHSMPSVAMAASSAWRKRGPDM